MIIFTVNIIIILFVKIINTKLYFVNREVYIIIVVYYYCFMAACCAMVGQHRQPVKNEIISRCASTRDYCALRADLHAYYAPFNTGVCVRV